VAVDFTRRLAEGVRQALGPDIAAQREGFGRFCRETLGLEAATLLGALGVPPTDDDAIVDPDPVKAGGYAGGGPSAGGGGSPRRRQSARI
jgi:hypothetical protein